MPKDKSKSVERRKRRIDNVDDFIGVEISVCRDNRIALDMAYEIRHTVLALLLIKTLKFEIGEEKKLNGTAALSTLLDRVQRTIGLIEERAVKIEIQNMEGNIKGDVRDQLRRLADNPAFSDDIDKYQEALLQSFVESNSGDA